MDIKEAQCPDCGGLVIVDGGLFDIGSVRLRCAACAHYFLPSDSPHSRTVRDVTNAGVEITIWEPEELR